MSPSIDYDEVSGNKVSMKYPLEHGIIMTFICETMHTVLSPIHEEHISLDNQIEYILQNPYRVGENTLSIFVKGIRLECGVDYKEVSPRCIKLIKKPYDAGTKIIFRQESLHNNGQVLYNLDNYQQKTWKLELVAEQNQDTLYIVTGKQIGRAHV